MTFARALTTIYDVDALHAIDVAEIAGVAKLNARGGRLGRQPSAKKLQLASLPNTTLSQRHHAPPSSIIRTASAPELFKKLQGVGDLHRHHPPLLPFHCCSVRIVFAFAALRHGQLQRFAGRQGDARLHPLRLLQILRRWRVSSDLHTCREYIPSSSNQLGTAPPSLTSPAS